jgi:DNA polymerase III subunit beta
MKLSLTLPRAALLPLVARAIKVVERRNTIPILDHLVLSAAADGGIAITATDLDIWIAETLPAGTANVSAAGAVALKAGLLHDVLRKLPEGEVKIEGDKARVTVSAGRSRFAVNALPAEDLPEARQVTAKPFHLNPTALAAIADCVSFAISSEETRYYLNGIYLHAFEDTLTAVATDGHRLSRLALPAPEGMQPFKGAIVPKKTCGLIAMLCEAASGAPASERQGKLEGGADNAIAIAIDDNAIRLSAGPLVITSKLIDGTFPDYQRVVPAPPPLAVTLALEPLKAAIDRVATVSAEKGRAVKWTLTPGELALTVTSADTGTADETLAAETSGEPSTGTLSDGFAIGFNARYVADLLATLDGPSVTFRFSDPGSPARVEDPADARRTMVLMPMRV